MMKNKFIVSWDGLLPIVGVYDEGVINVNNEMNEWLFPEVTAEATA